MGEVVHPGTTPDVIAAIGSQANLTGQQAGPESAALAAFWAKQREYWSARDHARRLRAELRQMAYERERTKLTRLSPNQRLVMMALVNDEFGDSEYCYYRRNIEAQTGLNRDQVGRALGALRRLGFVALHRGLFTDDGAVAGSGYATTRSGHDWWWSKEAPQPPTLGANAPDQSACEESDAAQVEGRGPGRPS